MALPLQRNGVFGRAKTVIVVILGVAVLGLFVISLTSSFLDNRRERS